MLEKGTILHWVNFGELQKKSQQLVNGWKNSYGSEVIFVGIDDSNSNCLIVSFKSLDGKQGFSVSSKYFKETEHLIS